jgi:hypothetical protein
VAVTTVAEIRKTQQAWTQDLRDKICEPMNHGIMESWNHGIMTQDLRAHESSPEGGPPPSVCVASRNGAMSSSNSSTAPCERPPSFARSEALSTDSCDDEPPQHVAPGEQAASPGKSADWSPHDRGEAFPRLPGEAVTWPCACEQLRVRGERMGSQKCRKS